MKRTLAALAVVAAGTFVAASATAQDDGPHPPCAGVRIQAGESTSFTVPARPSGWQWVSVYSKSANNEHRGQSTVVGTTFTSGEFNQNGQEQAISHVDLCKVRIVTTTTTAPSTTTTTLPPTTTTDPGTTTTSSTTTSTTTTSTTLPDTTTTSSTVPDTTSTTTTEPDETTSTTTTVPDDSTTTSTVPETTTTDSTTTTEPGTTTTEPGTTTTVPGVTTTTEPPELPVTGSNVGQTVLAAFGTLCIGLSLWAWADRKRTA